MICYVGKVKHFREYLATWNREAVRPRVQTVLNETLKKQKGQPPESRKRIKVKLPLQYYRH